ncbi:MAG: ATPase P [Candidatus Latescibacterota bacterium]|jgi:P-type E1-E2 ATPase
MIQLNIPGKDPVRVECLVLDYNGTMAVDGLPRDGCLERLARLGEIVEVHVVTADTFGTVTGQLSGSGFTVEILPPGRQDEAKAAYVRKLGLRTTVAVGNGANDARMLREAALGIAVVQQEGAAFAAIQNADAVFSHINDALDALLQPDRLVATLRI